MSSELQQQQRTSHSSRRSAAADRTQRELDLSWHAAGRVPQRVRITGSVAGWIEREIEELILGRIAAREQHTKEHTTAA
jgi:hypothetical protein